MMATIPMAKDCAKPSVRWATGTSPPGVPRPTARPTRCTIRGYLAGGYNRLTTTIAGRDVENEDLVNLPNWLPLTFRIDDAEWFKLDAVEILADRQELDLKAGLLRRDLRFRDAQGRTTRWRETRLVSMADPHVAGLQVDLMAEDWSGRLTVRTALDGSITNSGVRRYRDLASRHLDTQELNHLSVDTMFLRTQTNQSLIHVAQAARTRLYRDGVEIEAERQAETLADQVRQDINRGAGGSTDRRREDGGVPHVERSGYFGAWARSEADACLWTDTVCNK